MYYFQTAIKDTTLYKQQETSNTGLDEILEISKTYYGDLLDIAHPILKFDIGEITTNVATLGGSVDSAELILKECESSEIQTEYEVLVYPVSQSWDMGIGTRFDNISTDGATWISATTDYDWTNVGGDFLTTVSGSETLVYLGSDLNIDVLDITNQWIASTIDNHGFLLKYSDTFEQNVTDYGTLQYFSKETNTIYQPKLRIGWDDQNFNNGSLPELTADDIHVTFKRLKSKYKVGSVARIGVFGRDKYPLKTYTNQYSYNDIEYLPIGTWYQIKDALTDEIIIPFGTYTQVSCDPTNGNYFNINFSNWEVNRDYYIEIKTTRVGVTQYFSDNNLTFNLEL